MSEWRKVVWRAVQWSTVAAFVAAAAGWQLRIGRQLIVGPNQANADTPDAMEAPEGVYVPESELAMERLNLAQKMERLKEWNKSADLYQEILTDPKYATKVVPAEGDADQRLYRSVEELVVQRLAHWPTEGLDVYRARYETPASTLLQSAKGDPGAPGALHQVFSGYFVTESGKAAGILLIDRYLENGEFRAAAAIADRLLQWHPNLAGDRSAVLYRAALAFHLIGDDREAKAHLADLKKHDPQAKGIVRGSEVVLADSLAAELDQPAPMIAGANGDSYTTFGGDAGRNRVVAVSGTPGAHLYSIPLSKVPFGNLPQAAANEARYREQVKNGLDLGIMPVVDRGELFFQDGLRIYAADLESGVPPAEWVKSNGPDHGGAFRVPGLSESHRMRQLTLTVTERALLAVMGEQDPNTAAAYVQHPGETRLVCINRQTGKQNWIALPAQFKQESLRTLQLGGAPLVVGDNVLLVGTAVKQAGFEDCYVLCLGLEDGVLRWATNIASSSTLSIPGGMMFTAFYLAPNHSHLAYANGRVFVQTNRGAVAAVDVYNGMIDWLATYNRGQQATNIGFSPMMLQQQRDLQNQTKPWTYNPVIVAQGLVFTLPIEGRNLLIFDAATGKRFKQIDLDDLGQRVRSDDEIEPLKFDTLVGVSSDVLVLAGNKSVVALNWKTYNSQRYDDKKMLFWEEGYAQEIRGRPFLSQEQLYLATQERMFMVNMKNGFAEKDYPQYPRTWGDDEGPGNMVVTSDHAIIAGAEHVDVYTDLAAAKAKLNREVAESPRDPRPRLRYAEVTYAAGDYATSLAKLDEAIERAGGADLRPGPVRDRIFNDALTFAQKLKADVTPEGRQRVEALFDRAAQAAYSPQQQVNYRIDRASFDQSKDDLAGAVELYQQVLSDPQWRSVTLADEDNAGAAQPASADLRARDEIARLIRRDPSVYSKFEAEAAQSLQTAEETTDPSRLLAIAQRYPNSSVAPKAMLSAARAYETAGQTTLARRVLLDMYFDREAKSDQRAQIVEALARTDLRTASRLLTEGAAELNDPKLQQPIRFASSGEIPAGTRFLAVATALKNSSLPTTPTTLPAFRLPLPPADPEATYPKPFLSDAPLIGNVDALVLPIDGFSRPDKIVTWSSRPALNVYSPGAQTPLASSDRISERPHGSAWVGNDLLVWGAKKLSMLHENGSVGAWKIDITGLPPIEVLTPEEVSEDAAAGADVNNFVQRRAFARGLRGMPAPFQAAQPNSPATVGPEQIDRVLPLSDHLVLTTNTGRVVSLDRSDGKVAWQLRLSDRPVTRIVANEDFTVALAESNSSIRLQVLDTSSGHVRASRWFARSSNSYPQNIALSADGTLVYTLPDRLCLKNLYKPDKAWNQRPIERPLAPPANFLGMSGLDQLLIAGQRILAVSDSGGGNRSGEKFVHVYSLETGAPNFVQVGPRQQIEQTLSAATKSPEVRLLVAGPRLFTVSPDACNAYDLNHPEQSVSMYNQQSEPPPAVFAVLPANDFIAFIGDDLEQAGAPGPTPAEPRPASAPAIFLSAYGRALGPRGEIDRLDYQLKLDDPAGITREWQAFDGGICYRTTDRKLHLLMGARPNQ